MSRGSMNSSRSTEFRNPPVIRTGVVASLGYRHFVRAFGEVLSDFARSWRFHRVHPWDRRNIISTSLLQQIDVSSDLGSGGLRGSKPFSPVGQFTPGAGTPLNQIVSFTVAWRGHWGRTCCQLSLPGSGSAP